MKPTKYELLIQNGSIYLRGYAKETVKGYFNVEAVAMMTGKALPRLRKEGAKLAKRWNVPFVDKTARVAQ